MSHINLNQHLLNLKNSLAFLTGRDDLTIEVSFNHDAYADLRQEYMMDDDMLQPLTIHGITLTSNKKS